MTRDNRLDSDDERALVRFVYHEARLLDERRFDEWLGLFAADGLYWVPSQPAQASSTETLSLFCERKPLLAVRIERLAHPNLFSDQPVTRTHHQIGAVLPERSSLARVDFEVHASLIVCEYRAGDMRWFAGRTDYHLRRCAPSSALTDGPDCFEIVQKRVDLINCDAPHRILSVPF